MLSKLNRLCFENPFFAVRSKQRQQCSRYHINPRQGGFPFVPFQLSKQRRKKERQRDRAAANLGLVRSRFQGPEIENGVLDSGRFQKHFQLKCGIPTLCNLASFTKSHYSVQRLNTAWDKNAIPEMFFFYFTATPERSRVSKDCSGVRAFGGGGRRSVRYSRIARFGASGPESGRLWRARSWTRRLFPVGKIIS